MPRISRRLIIPALAGLLVLVGSIAVVSAQTGGDDPGPADQGVTAQGGPENDGDHGPPWTRANFPCNTDDPNGRGGPPSLCGKGGVALEGGDLPPGQAKKLGDVGITAGPPSGFPGHGRGPAWARAEFTCNASDDGGHGGPPWRCGGVGAQAQGQGQGVGPRGPAWLR